MDAIGTACARQAAGTAHRRTAELSAVSPRCLCKLAKLLNLCLGSGF